MKTILLATVVALSSCWAIAGDCIQQSGKNCVDLCAVDPGNARNHGPVESKEMSRMPAGSCRGIGLRSRPDRNEIRVTAIERYYDICGETWRQSERTFETHCQVD